MNSLRRLTSLAFVWILGVLLAASASAAESRGGPWHDVAPAAGASDLTPPAIGSDARAARTLSLDADGLRALLGRAPREGAPGGVILSLPRPQGGFERFEIEESPVMEPALAAQFPELRTFRGVGVDDRTATARLDWTPNGFHAIVLGAGRTVFIDPQTKGDLVHYVVYDKKDYGRKDGHAVRCATPGADAGEEALAAELREALGATPNSVVPLVATPVSLRTYRLAVAATAEYTAVQGGTSPALAAITTTVNRVNAIFEREVAVHFSLVGSESLLVYADPTTDPYTNETPSVMVCENAANLDSVIKVTNYDLGLVLSTTPASDVTGVGTACKATTVACAGSTLTGSAKGAGVTGSATPSGDPFDVDDVAHALAHQLGAHHTFNGTTGACGSARGAATAYEPGSGSTIMGYGGACGAQNIQSNADDYFHVASLQEIGAYMAGGGACGSVTTPGNSTPVVVPPAGATIPRQTPFTLTATDASDPDVSDAVTVAWEELDLGPASANPAGDTDATAARPVFRSFPPTASLSRTFPQLADVLDPAHPHYGESLPTRARDMTFGVTARDNHAGVGGHVTGSTTVTVDAASGPFTVTGPAQSDNWEPGSSQTVTWNVAGTDVAPVSCADVMVSLSTDGGQTFPTVLLPTTPNDGTEGVTIDPDTLSATARVKVECLGNVFFNISPAFTIEPTASVANPAPVVEGNSSTQLVSFPVTLSKPVPASETVTVSYATADGTATAVDGDYVPAVGTITFNPGDTTQNVDIAVKGDVVYEADETFALNLTSAAGALIVGGQAAATIINDDSQPAFSASDVFVTEGNSGTRKALFTVTLTPASGVLATVQYATADVSATAGADYTAASGTLSFAPGVTKQTVSVIVRGDVLIEGNETFALNLSIPTNATIASAGTGTILDDDSGGTFSFSSPNYTVSENAAFATITVSRVGTLAGATVDYTTVDGSAVSTGVAPDYQATSGTLTFLGRRPSATFKVPILKDTLHEGNEKVLLTLSNPQGLNAALGVQRTAVLTIADNDSGGTIQFAATAYTVNASAGATSVALTVKRLRGLASAVTVHYSMVDGTAVGGVDYDNTPGDLTFQSSGVGATTQTITIPVAADPTGAKAFTVELSSPGGGAVVLVTRAIAKVTILGAEPTIGFSSATYTAKTTSPSFSVTVKRSAPLTGVVTVAYAATGGSAVNGVDYTLAPGTLTFAPNATTRTIKVAIAKNTLVSPPKDVTLTLSPPIWSNGTARLDGLLGTSTLTLVDPNATPTVQFSASTYTVNEATPKATITVRRTGALAGTVTVTYDVTGTATNGGPSADYNLTVPGVLTFGPNQTVKTIPVPIVNDAIDEGTETAVFTLSAPTWTGGTALAGPDATLRIVDNETTVQFGSVAYAASEAAKTAAISVRRTGNLTGTTTVSYASTGGTASVGPDYGLVTGSLTFAPGQTLRTFLVSIVHDTLAETPETINLALSNPQGAQFGTPSTTVLTLRDNDAAGKVQFNASDYSVDELAGTVTITVTRSGGAASAATVDYDTNDDTAVAPGDYTATSGTLTFGAGEITKTFTIPVVDDATANGGTTKDLILSLSSPGGNLALGARPTAALWIVKE